jgi:hypothetical protein
MERTLTPEEAQAVVDQRIEEFGLSSLPSVRVAATERGGWEISWDRFRQVEPAMTAPQWCDWLERHVGPMDPSRLETLEG